MDHCQAEARSCAARFNLLIVGHVSDMSSARDVSAPGGGATAGGLLEPRASGKGAEQEVAIEAAILGSADVAARLARRHAPRGAPREDLEQVAYLALLKAARRFDGPCAEDFVLYAVETIVSELRSWFRTEVRSSSLAHDPRHCGAATLGLG